MDPADAPFPQRQRPITIAILAMGGEGGGVLADWIIDLAENNRYIAQLTSGKGICGQRFEISAADNFSCCTPARSSTPNMPAVYGSDSLLSRSTMLRNRRTDPSALSTSRPSQ